MKTAINVGFLYTSHCNAQCIHCSTDCGPKSRVYLDEETISRTIRQAAAIFPDRPLHICFSGGEPFLDLELICRLLAYARASAAEVTCVTNAYWAVDTEAALCILQRAKSCGLSGLAVSASQFHEPFVSPMRVVTALSAAKEVGLGITLKFPSVFGGESVQEWAARWKCDLSGVAVEEFPVMPHLRAGERLPDRAYQRTAGIPAGRCPGAVVTYRESGDAYTCCTPGGFVDSLKIGNVRVDDFETIFNRFATGGMQQLLRAEGPAHFVPHIMRAGLSVRLREEYDGVCDLCTHLLADKEMASVCNRVALEKEIATFKIWLTDGTASGPIQDEPVEHGDSHAVICE